MKRCIRGSQDTSLDSKIQYNDINSLIYNAFGIKIGGSTNPKKDFRSWMQDGAIQCKFTIWFHPDDPEPESDAKYRWIFSTAIAKANSDALLRYYGLSDYDEYDPMSKNNDLESLVSRFRYHDLNDLLRKNYPEYSIYTTVEGRGNYYGAITVKMDRQVVELPDNYFLNKRFKGRVGDLSKEEQQSIRMCAYWIAEGQKKGETLDSIVDYVRARTIDNPRSSYHGNSSFDDTLAVLDSCLYKFQTIEDLASVGKYLKR